MKKALLIKNTLFYVIAISLISGYFFILYQGFHPKVCLEYQLYYVDKKIITWPKYGGLKYILGTKEDFTSQTGPNINDAKRKGTGWSVVEEDGGTWTEGPEAYLYYSNVDTSAYKALSFNIGIQAHMEGVTADVYANNVYQDTINDFSKTNHRIKINKDCMAGDNRLEIKIEINNCISPHELGQGDDARKLGLLVDSVTIDGENND